MRTWIFPSMRIVIFLAIAAALVKIAFFADPAGTGSSESPTGQISDPTVAVALGTITNDVTVTGAVSADPALPVKGTLAGEVTKLLATVGQSVDATTPVLSIRSETPGAIAADGTSAAPVVKTVTVTAGAVGVLSSVAVIVGQSVAVGDTIAQVAPTTFSVSGTIAPEQQYRLIAKPADALVTITGGPAPFTCTGLTITSALAGAATATTGGAAPTPGATVSCAVPADVTVFGGLAAKLTLSGGAAENVMVVPVTAVEGTTGAGNVYVAAAAGEPTAKPVVLGLTDGKNVEIKSGLAEGDEVLKYVPGAAADEGIDDGNGCKTFPDGSVTCASN